MKRVVIESPYTGDTVRNVAYARAAVADAIQRGEAPFASHLLYTQPGILVDLKPEERALGINCGYAWGDQADLVAVYDDYGLSDEMKSAVGRYKERGLPVEHRRLESWKWDDNVIADIMSGLTAATETLERIPRVNADTRSAMLLMLIGILETVKRDAIHEVHA